MMTAVKLEEILPGMFFTMAVLLGPEDTLVTGPVYLKDILSGQKDLSKRCRPQLY